VTSCCAWCDGERVLSIGLLVRINVEHLHHGHHESATGLRLDDPLFFAVRLKRAIFIFFTAISLAALAQPRSVHPAAGNY